MMFDDLGAHANRIEAGLLHDHINRLGPQLPAPREPRRRVFLRRLGHLLSRARAGYPELIGNASPPGADDGQLRAAESAPVPQT